MEEAENNGRDTLAHGSAEEGNGEQEADEEEEAGGAGGDEDGDGGTKTTDGDDLNSTAGKLNAGPLFSLHSLSQNLSHVVFK